MLTEEAKDFLWGALAIIIIYGGTVGFFYYLLESMI